ncbi:hypothetical protein MMC25_002526 [Agyrium rufum]|nr:hypothetical protein [Agyrium rufum]
MAPTRPRKIAPSGSGNGGGSSSSNTITSSKNCNSNTILTQQASVRKTRPTPLKLRVPRTVPRTEPSPEAHYRCGLCGYYFARSQIVYEPHFAKCVKARGNPEEKVWDSDPTCWKRGKKGPSGARVPGLDARNQPINHSFLDEPKRKAKGKARGKAKTIVQANVAGSSAATPMVIDEAEATQQMGMGNPAINTDAFMFDAPSDIAAETSWNQFDPVTTYGGPSSEVDASFGDEQRIRLLQQHMAQDEQAIDASSSQQSQVSPAEPSVFSSPGLSPGFSPDFTDFPDGLPMPHQETFDQDGGCQLRFTPYAGKYHETQDLINIPEQPSNLDNVHSSGLPCAESSSYRNNPESTHAFDHFIPEYEMEHISSEGSDSGFENDDDPFYTPTGLAPPTGQSSLDSEDVLNPSLINFDAVRKESTSTKAIDHPEFDPALVDEASVEITGDIPEQFYAKIGSPSKAIHPDLKGKRPHPGWNGLMSTKTMNKICNVVIDATRRHAACSESNAQALYEYWHQTLPAECASKVLPPTPGGTIHVRPWPALFAAQDAWSTMLHNADTLMHQVQIIKLFRNIVSALKDWEGVMKIQTLFVEEVGELGPMLLEAENGNAAHCESNIRDTSGDEQNMGDWSKSESDEFEE